MNKIIALLVLVLISCNTKRIATNSLKEDRVEIIEYRNFNGHRIEKYGKAIIRKYFENNKLTSVKFFDLNDQLVKNEKSWDKINAEWRFDYDQEGNFTRQIAYDSMGEICEVENWGNSAIEVFKYNEKNQLIEKINYNKSMELVGLGDIGDASTKYGYNDKGQLIWQKSFDSKSNFIKNGFCYSKFKYNDDGTLSKHFYYYDEDKLNTYSTYSYDGGNLIKEETFNEENNKIGYEIYSYNASGRIIKIEDWYYKWEKPNIKKEQISLELDGWIIPDSAKLVFNNFGEGEYNISISEEGKILNIKPIKYKGGTAEFDMEVYRKFKKLRLKKDIISEEAKLEETLKVCFLFQEIGRFYDIKRVINPNPENNY
jgi:hypothetical protein